MGIVRKQSSINTILTYIGFGIGFVNVIILYPKLLSQEEFGLSRLLIELSSIVTGITMIGVPSVMVRFYPNYKKKQDTDLFGLLFIAITLALLISLGCIFLFRDFIKARYCTDSSIFKEYYHLIFVMIAFNVYLHLFNNLAVSNEKTVVGVFTQQLFSRLFPLLLLLVVYLKLIDFNTFIYLFSLNGLGQLVITILYLKKYKLILFNFKVSETSKLLFKPMVVYGFSIYIVLLVEVVAGSIQVLAISHIHGIANTAVFTVAAHIGQIITIPQKSIALIALPLLAKHWLENDFEEINTLYKKSSLNLTIVGVFIFIIINVNLESIFDFIGSSYKDGLPVAMLMSVAYLIDLTFGINNEILVSSRYWRFNSMTHIFLLLLLIPTNYVFIKSFGIIGAAYSLILSLTIYNSWRMLFLYKKHKLFPFSFANITIIAYGFFLMFIIRIIYQKFGFTASPNFIENSLIISSKVLIIFVLYMIPIYYLKISEDINGMIATLFKRLKKNN